MAVFKRGTVQGLIGLILFGGHNIPISGVGESALWKNVQKNETKNINSDIINKINPVFTPFTICEVWEPKNVDSRIMFCHHNITRIIILRNPIEIVNVLFFWNQLTSPEVIIRVEAAPIIGQGLWSTIWKGCWCKLFMYWYEVFLSHTNWK